MMKVLFAALLMLTGTSFAEPTVYQEQNFSIEWPATWKKAEVPPQALALFRSAEGTKGVVVMAFKIPEAERPKALINLYAGARNAAAKSGTPITGEWESTLGGVPSRAYQFTLPNNVNTVSTMAAAGEWAYSIQGFSGVSDPVTDPEVNNIIQSFTLLAKPAPPPPAKTRVEGSDAYKFGQLMGRILFWVFIAGLIVWLVQKTRSRGRG